jgi:CheY-like chemotaxis protein
MLTKETVHPRCRILIVEDNAINRRALQRLLEGMNLHSSAASTVSEAMEKLSEQRPHLLIVDVHLPDGSGEDVARSARATDPDCRIAFLTGSANKADLSFEADAFFLKPVKPDELLTWIQHVCNGILDASAE